MGRLRTKVLELTFAPKPNPRVKAQIWGPRAIPVEFHTPVLVIRPSQGWLLSEAKGPLFLQTAHQQVWNPLEARSHIQPSPEFIGCWTGLCLPCPSPPTHTHLPPSGTWICICSSKILHPHLSSHSALEVNIIKYILILKYSVSILVRIKSAFVICKKKSELTTQVWG